CQYGLYRRILHFVLRTGGQQSTRHLGQTECLVVTIKQVVIECGPKCVAVLVGRPIFIAAAISGHVAGPPSNASRKVLGTINACSSVWRGKSDRSTASRSAGVAFSIRRATPWTS